MAVVTFEESLTGRGVSGEYRQSFRYTRSFMVQTDHPNTSLVDIANAPGVSFGDVHPNDSTVYALKFDAKPIGENPLLYEVNVEYGLPPAEETASDPSGGGGGGSGTAAPNFAAAPPDVWSGGSSLSTVGTMSLPKTAGGSPVPVTNTAGVLFADITVEQARYTLSLARSYTDTGFLALLAANTNAVNSTTWAGCEPNTWLCKGARWDRHQESNSGTTLLYYRVTWEFEYNPDKWTLVLNSVGYSELVSGKLKPILDGDGKPVSEPVALLANGTAAGAGIAPAQITYYPHKQIDFNTAFGGVF